ncbi:MAG: GNAT family N-acetyltransferase [Actinotalea sp.]|nr:GNAT family N-acetyltransferase [Actinotalea sp.]
MLIRPYDRVEDEASLFDMILQEGGGWSEYLGPSDRHRYATALASSTTYVAREDAVVCGYVRCRGDDGLGVYVHDLLVRRSHRGRHLGRALLDRVRADFGGQPVYVLSDVDAYYEGLGYPRAGSVFRVVDGTGGGG